MAVQAAPVPVAVVTATRARDAAARTALAPTGAATSAEVHAVELPVLVVRERVVLASAAEVQVLELAVQGRPRQLIAAAERRAASGGQLAGATGPGAMTMHPPADRLATVAGRVGRITATTLAAVETGRMAARALAATGVMAATVIRATFATMARTVTTTVGATAVARTAIPGRVSSIATTAEPGAQRGRTDRTVVRLAARPAHGQMATGLGRRVREAAAVAGKAAIVHSVTADQDSVPGKTAAASATTGRRGVPMTRAGRAPVDTPERPTVIVARRAPLA